MPAGAGQEDRLDEELLEDVARPGAEGLADADLAGPLLDRDEHDVHDPDAADQQADRGDDDHDQVGRAGDLVVEVEHRVLGQDGEVVGLAEGDLAALAEEAGDLLDRLVERVRLLRGVAMISRPSFS